MAGPRHPAIMKAAEEWLSTSTMCGMPHNMEWELAEEICKRFPLEMASLDSSGTEAGLRNQSEETQTDRRELPLDEGHRQAEESQVARLGERELAVHLCGGGL
jgi:hypothetical protein